MSSAYDARFSLGVSCVELTCDVPADVTIPCRDDASGFLASLPSSETCESGVMAVGCDFDMGLQFVTKFQVCAQDVVGFGEPDGRRAWADVLEGGFPGGCPREEVAVDALLEALRDGFLVLPAVGATCASENL